MIDILINLVPVLSCLVGALTAKLPTTLCRFVASKPVRLVSQWVRRSVKLSNYCASRITIRYFFWFSFPKRCPCSQINNQHWKNHVDRLKNAQCNLCLPNDRPVEGASALVFHVSMACSDTNYTHTSLLPYQLYTKCVFFFTPFTHSAWFQEFCKQHDANLFQKLQELCRKKLNL